MDKLASPSTIRIAIHSPGAYRQPPTLRRPKPVKSP
jgi:hypothetical protein